MKVGRDRRDDFSGKVNRTGRDCLSGHLRRKRPVWASGPGAANRHRGGRSGTLPDCRTCWIAL